MNQVGNGLDTPSLAWTPAVTAAQEYELKAAQLVKTLKRAERKWASESKACLCHSSWNMLWYHL